MLCCCFLILAALHGAEPDVVAHWPLDGLSGGMARDEGPNSLHAEARGEFAADFVRPGLDGQALYFDNGRNSLTVADCAALDLTDGFSIACVVYPLSVDGFRTILWKGNRQRIPQQVGYYLDLRDGKVELKTMDAKGRWIVYSTRPVVKAGAWHAIRVSYDKGRVRFWVNHQVQETHRSEDGRPDAALLANDGPLVIGAGGNRDGVAYSFLGLIDDVKILATASGGPSDSERTEWQPRLRAFERREIRAKIDLLRERIRAIAASGLGQREQETLERLVSVCDDVARAEDGNAEERLAGVAKELDALDFSLFYQAHAEPGAAFMLAPMRTCDRLVKQTRFFDALTQVEHEVRIECAGNEHEGFQIALLAGDKDIGPPEIALSDFTGPAGRILGKEHVEWGWVRPVSTETPDIVVDFVGPIPDAIIEGSPPPRVAPRDFETVFFRVNLPAGTPAGEYTGAVTFTAAGERHTITVHLRVFGFSLPERGTLKIAFSFFEHFYARWYGLKEVPFEQQARIYDFLLKYRISPNNIYSHDKTYPALEHIKANRERMNFFTYSTADRGSKSLAETYADIERRGLAEHAYFYCFDELSCHEDRIPEARRFTAALRDAVPNARIMQTSFPNDNIRELFNVWCPVIHYFEMPGKRDTLARMIADGEEVWWYLADAPVHPFPNLFLDYPPFDARILGVLSHLYGVEGVLYWSINREWATNEDAEPCWPEGEWKAHIFHAHTGARKHKNGMGNLIYPGPDGRLYPSLRLENLRDGVEDHMYLTLLAGLSEQGASSSRVAKLRNVPEDVARAANDYNADPGPLLAHRRAVGLALENALE